MTDGGSRSQSLADVVVERSSVRAFRSDPVPTDAVERAVAAAGWAPSPHGTQPWRFALLISATSRRDLADAMAQTWRDQLVLDEVDQETIEHRVQLSKDRIETAPVVAILCLYLGDAHQYPDPGRQAAEQLMAIQSLGAAAQNFLLTLHAEGLDAGWMCAPLFCPDIVRATIGLEHTMTPHAMFPIGRAARPPRRRPRRPAQDLIVART